MDRELGLHKIYKETLIAVLAVAAVMLGTAFFYEYKVNPGMFSIGTGVREVEKGSIGTGNADGKAEQSRSASASAAAPGDGRYLTLDTSGETSEYMWIPMPEGVDSSGVVIENHYMDRQLWVSVDSDDSSFYDTKSISGDLDGVSYGELTESDGRLVLKFALDSVYEFNTIFEDGVLYVEKVEPRELYDRIVVIDPDGQIPDELLQDDSLTPSRICLDIAVRLQDLLEAEGIRVYMTSLDDRELTDDDRLALSADVRPDMFIRIETGYDEDSKVYGTETVYNGTYFIPGFGSTELADMLESDVTTAIGGKAMGLTEAGDTDAVIRGATVPAAAVRVGYYTNIQENILLNREDYRSKIAKGIYSAVMDSYKYKDGEE